MTSLRFLYVYSPPTEHRPLSGLAQMALVVDSIPSHWTGQKGQPRKPSAFLRFGHPEQVEIYLLRDVPSFEDRESGKDTLGM